MRPPKHIPKPVRKVGGARATKLSDQIASPTVELAASQAAHFDNYFVEQFAYAMRIKLAVKRQEGRGGWQDKEFCSGDFLSQLLREHVEKGDPVDVANFCMMLHQRGERISPPPSPNMDGWKDINSAARDGSEVLIWNGRRRHVAHFDKIEGEWVSSFKTTTKRLVVAPPPTHWSPLPAEPATTEGQS